MKWDAACLTWRRFIVLLVLMEALMALLVAPRLSIWGRDEVGAPTFPTIMSSGDHNPEDPEQKAAAMEPLISSFDIPSAVERVPPRAFPLWNNGTVPLPCPRADPRWSWDDVQRTTTRTGILFVKSHKTGSSTGSSVTLRLASRIFERNASSSSPPVGGGPPNTSSVAAERRQRVARMCRNRFNHANTARMGYDQRDRARSILWSLVRDPTDRLLSEFFHLHVSRPGRNASDDSVFRDYLESNRERLPSVQVRYLSLRNLDVSRSASASAASGPMDAIRSIFRDYDFVGVTERMDESLVALQMLLGLEASDVVYMSSKVSGGYDDGWYQNRCVYIQRSFRTPAMNEFFRGPVWAEWSQWDAVLHRAANRSLDLTIDRLGRNRFRESVAAFRALQRSVHAACSGEVQFPCDASRHGLSPRTFKETGCIRGDSGCGFACIDRYLASTAGKVSRR